MRVLVIQDNPNKREQYGNLFDTKGIEIVMPDGLHSLVNELTSGSKFDLVFFTTVLWGPQWFENEYPVNGHHIARMIKQTLGDNTPPFVLTSIIEPLSYLEFRSNLKSEGVQLILDEPYSLGQIFSQYVDRAVHESLKLNNK